MPRITFFDHNGEKPLEMHQAKIEALPWALMAVTECRINIPRKEFLLDNFTDERRVRPAGIVFVQSNYLPDWAGVFWLPQTWGESFQIVAKSALHYFRKRFTDQRIKKNNTAGQAVLDALKQTLEEGFLPIIGNEDTIQKGQAPIREPVGAGTRILDLLDFVSERRGFEYRLEPELIDGQMRFYLHLRKRFMYDGIPIQVGRFGNAVWGTPPLATAGDIVTRWTMVKDASKKNLKGKHVFNDDFALDDFGLWEELIQDGSLQGKDDRVKRKLADNTNPQNRYKVVSKLNDLTTSLRTGSVHDLYGPGVGFTEDGRIGARTVARAIAFAYNDTNKSVEIVLEDFPFTRQED